MHIALYIYIYTFVYFLILQVGMVVLPSHYITRPIHRSVILFTYSFIHLFHSESKIYVLFLFRLPTLSGRGTGRPTDGKREKGDCILNMAWVITGHEQRSNKCFEYLNFRFAGLRGYSQRGGREKRRPRGVEEGTGTGRRLR